MHTHASILSHFKTCWCLKKECNVKQPQYISFSGTRGTIKMKTTCGINSNQLKVTSVRNMHHKYGFYSPFSPWSQQWLLLFILFNFQLVLLDLPQQYISMPQHCNTNAQMQASKGASHSPSVLTLLWFRLRSKVSCIILVWLPTTPALPPPVPRICTTAALIKVSEWWRTVPSIYLKDYQCWRLGVKRKALKRGNGHSSPLTLGTRK